MIRKRIIPCLQLIDESLVKTVRFQNYQYIGDPINTVRIFNELEVDELCFLDIRATTQNRIPNYKLLSEIAEECFMPLSYGGGITDLEMAKKILSIGFEKILINSVIFKNITLISDISKYSGSQSVIVSMDVKKDLFGRYHPYTNNGQKKIKKHPIQLAKEFEKLGAGEILLTSINNEGTWLGYDFEITKKISDAVSIPVIANGGAGNIRDIKKALNYSNASAVALGSMVVFQKKGMGVLVNFPTEKELNEALQ